MLALADMAQNGVSHSNRDQLIISKSAISNERKRIFFKSNAILFISFLSFVYMYVNLEFKSAENHVDSMW